MLTPYPIRGKRAFFPLIGDTPFPSAAVHEPFQGSLPRERGLIEQGEALIGALASERSMIEQCGVVVGTLPSERDMIEQCEVTVKFCFPLAVVEINLNEAPWKSSIPLSPPPLHPHPNPFCYHPSRTPSLSRVFIRGDRDIHRYRFEQFFLLPVSVIH